MGKLANSEYLPQKENDYAMKVVGQSMTFRVCYLRARTVAKWRWHYGDSSGDRLTFKNLDSCMA
jgi:hypothetical protein